MKDIKSLLNKYLFLLFCLAFSMVVFETAHAFPEMIKHGYVNCTACHVSTSGGGLLNSYGRNLSAELISTWSVPNEEKIFHGLVNTEKIDQYLAIGGDYRGVQVHKKNTDNTDRTVETGRYINMQANIEIGYISDLFSVVVAIGQYNFKDASHNNEILPYMNRAYVLYKPTDELSFKVGRFQPIFSLNIPDHMLFSKAPIGIGNYNRGYFEDKQTAEVAWQGLDYNFSGSVYKVLEDASSLNDQGFTLTAQKVFLETVKVGPQFLQEKNNNQTKQIIGLAGYLGWNEKWATLAEVNQVKTKPNNSKETTGATFYQRTSYEAYKGFNIAFLNDYYQTDLDSATKLYRYGPGVIWYPRPHFDFQFFFTKEQKDSYKQPGDYAWLMLHYYL